VPLDGMLEGPRSVSILKRFWRRIVDTPGRA
jgi:hypothetical protein